MPRIGVELEGRVFVPARRPPEGVPAERLPEPAPEPVPAGERPREAMEEPEVPEPAAPAVAEPTPEGLLAEDRFAEALELLDEAGEAAPPAVWRLRAEALQGLGRRTEAVWAYVAALPGADEIDAEDLRARSRALLDALGEEELARVAQECPLCPEGGYARLRRARLLYGHGQAGEAEALLGGVLSDFPEDPLGRVAEALLAQWVAVRSVVPGLYGLILPLSGPLQPIGERALRGALVASRLFEAGGEPGIRLLVEDSRGEPEDAARAVRALAARGVVGIAGPLKGSAAAEAARVARELGVPLIAPTPAPAAAGGGSFRLYLREEDEMARLAEHALGEAGLRRFAILYADTPLGRRYRDLFWGEVVARGGEITGVEAFPPGSRDHGDPIRRLTGVFGLTPAEVRERFVEQERERLVREQALLVALGLAAETDPEPEPTVDSDRLARFKPPPVVDFEAVFVPVSSVEAGQIAPQLPFHDVERVTLLGIRTWNHPALVQVGEEYVAGALFPAEFHPALAEARELVAAYQAEYGEPPGVIEAYAADAVRLLAGGAALLEPETRPALRRRLESLWAAPGVMGPLTTHPGGDVAAQAKILTVRRGRIVPVAP
ncbi:MAG: penicillin-binding protein activator [Thermodesulfobacteriota bacterium]